MALSSQTFKRMLLRAGLERDAVTELLSQLSAGSSAGRPLPPAPFNGFFGVDTVDPFVVEAGSGSAVPFGEAFLLNGTETVVDAVDNAYEAWDPAAPASLTVKQEGWYWYYWALTLAEVATEAIDYGFEGGVQDGLVSSIPAGSKQAQGSTLDYWAANTQRLSLLTVGSDVTTAAVTVSYAAVILYPLFEIAP